MLSVFFLIFGILAAFVGVLLTDVYKRGTKAYRFCRAVSIIGVIAVGIGVLLILSESLGPGGRNQCEAAGGIYVQEHCIDVEKLPQIEIPQGK